MGCTRLLKARIHLAVLALRNAICLRQAIGTIVHRHLDRGHLPPTTVGFVSGRVLGSAPDRVRDHRDASSGRVNPY
jgi:hypothetical protein